MSHTLQCAFFLRDTQRSQRWPKHFWEEVRTQGGVWAPDVQSVLQRIGTDASAPSGKSAAVLMWAAMLCHLQKSFSFSLHAPMPSFVGGCCRCAACTHSCCACHGLITNATSCAPFWAILQWQCHKLRICRSLGPVLRLLQCCSACLCDCTAAHSCATSKPCRFRHHIHDKPSAKSSKALHVIANELAKAAASCLTYIELCW